MPPHAKRPEREPTILVAFRLPESLVSALDREAERLERERPGAVLTRTDVVREILTRALAKRG